MNPPQHESTQAPNRRIDVIAPLLLLLGAFGLGAWYIFVRHPAYHDIEWIAFERGNQLYRAQALLDGKVLYRDIAFQYGPLAAYLHAAWCAVAGVGLTSTLAWHLTWSLVGIALGYRVFRRLLPATEAAVYSALLWVPFLLEPGGLVRMINAEHQTLDRIYLLSILLLWKPPTARTAWRAVGIGLALGAWQWTKFGGAIFAGASMTLVDLGWLLAQDRTPAAWKRWVANLAVIFATVTACEGLLAAWCLNWGTTAQAWDVLWPTYLTKAYDVALTPRWPNWHGALYLLQFQFLPLLCLLLGAMGWVRLSRHEVSNHAVAWIAAGFYLLGVGTYIRVEANFYLYAFALAPLAVSGLVTLPERARRLVTMMLVVPAVLLVRSALTPWAAPPGQPIPDQAFVLPNGESLFLTPDNVRRMQRLEAVAEQVHARPGDQVVLAWLGYEWEGGGYLHFYEPAYPLQNFFASPATVRAADVEWMRTELTRVGAIVLYAPGGTTEAARDRLSRFLPDDVVESVFGRFEKSDALSDYWIVVLMPRT